MIPSVFIIDRRLNRRERLRREASHLWFKNVSQKMPWWIDAKITVDLRVNFRGYLDYRNCRLNGHQDLLSEFHTCCPRCGTPLVTPAEAFRRAEAYAQHMIYNWAQDAGIELDEP